MNLSEVQAADGLADRLLIAAPQVSGAAFRACGRAGLLPYS